MPQMSQVLRERAIGMLTAGMSTRAVARELNVHFSTISRLQRHFREFGSTSNRPHNRRPHVTTPAQTSTSSIFTSKIVWDQPPGQLLQQSVCITKEFLHKLSETVSGKLICMLVVLIRVLTWLQFVVVTDLSGQMLTFDGVWHFGEVFSSRMNPGFHCKGRWQTVYGIVWVSGLLMSTLWMSCPWWRWGYGMGSRMLWTTNTGAFYWWHFECTEIPRRDPEAHCCTIHPTITSCCSMIMHGPMLQGSVHNSWKLKTSQFLHGQHTHRTCHPLSMFGMLWIGVFDSVFQFLPISSNFAQPLKRSGPTSHRPQSTTWSTLCEGDVLHCVRQMVVTPDTDWFSDPPNTVKLHILEWPFIVASLRHTCAIIMLSNQHLDVPHLWGGWIISAKEKCSLSQI